MLENKYEEYPRPALLYSVAYLNIEDIQLVNDTKKGPKYCWLIELFNLFSTVHFNK